MTDLGQVIPGQGGSFWFFVDHLGDCWFTIWRKGGHYPHGGHGNLYRIRGETGEIRCYNDVLPDCRLAPQGEPVAQEKWVDRSWTWAHPLPGRQQSLFTMSHAGGDDERLWIFDPTKGIETGEAFHPVGYIGPTFLPVALGADRVYYVQMEDLASARQCSTGEGGRDDDPDIVGRPEKLHLRSISLSAEAAGAVTDHGQIVDQDGRTPRHIDSLAAARDGLVYLVGGWHLLQGETSTLQINWEKPERSFQPVPRAQRFAYVAGSADQE
jgi:hypothetical protein